MITGIEKPASCSTRTMSTWSGICAWWAGTATRARAARDSCGRGGAVRRPRRQWGTFGGLRGGAVERVWRRLGARTKRADERERARAARLTVVGLRARKSGRFVQRTRPAGTKRRAKARFTLIQRLPAVPPARNTQRMLDPTGCTTSTAVQSRTAATGHVYCTLDLNVRTAISAAPPKSRTAKGGGGVSQNPPRRRRVAAVLRRQEKCAQSP